ncbi:MAG: hypothetical protein KAG61_13875 [Bacteriovoracaceae bacterium]|nr:hypothetical protein [Bacteriovoracaceae bacterium]
MLTITNRIKLTTILFLLVFGTNSYTQEVHAISLGPVKLGESRVPINLTDFLIRTDIDQKRLKVVLIKDSIQWIRNQFNLLIPRARMGIKIYRNGSSITVEHSRSSIVPEKHETYFYLELYLSLFDSGKVKIYEGKNLLGNVWLEAQAPSDKTKTNLIDYSCSRYGVELEGVDNEYISVGCHLERLGSVGSETPRLEITWSATNLRLLNDASEPYITVLSQGNKASVDVIDRTGKIKTIDFKANIPKRLKRFKVGLGIGPYQFISKNDGMTKSSTAPSAMLYSNLMLTKSTSLRMFDALIAKNSIFNNFGVYFAYDLANILDNRIQIVPLIGFQHLYFKYDKSSSEKQDFIYPQGFEINYRHAFGMENYLLGYGMFISTSSDYEYKNIWVRFGKRIFTEINYIEWAREDRKASMLGLSFGFPLFSAI